MSWYVPVCVLYSVTYGLSAALLIGSEMGPKREGASQRGKFIDFVAAKQREVSKKVSTKQK